MPYIRITDGNVTYLINKKNINLIMFEQGYTKIWLSSHRNPFMFKGNLLMKFRGELHIAMSLIPYILVILCTVVCCVVWMR